MDKPVVVAACRDLEPGIKKTADSLVVLATAKMTADIEYMFGDSSEGWETAKTRNPQAALNLYDQALAVAPGHCAATFGRAMASAMMVTQDPKLDAFVKKAEAADQGNGNTGVLKIGSGRALFKMTPDQAAPVLLKLSADMKNVDLPTVTEFQSLVETSLMPRVDSTVAAMEEALKYENFTFEFTAKEGRVFQLDHGEIGPALAGLKVLKAWLTVAAGYQWELAVDGKFAWMDTVNRIDGAEFDHLTPGQTAALDHVTGLFQTGSPFSKIKPAWKARVNGIPALLLSAVNDAQKGLRYAIAEAGKSTGQEHDLYVVGTGTEADVDPADLQEAVDLLEKSKKYLTGEVNLTYNMGIRSLKVDFTKIFQVDGAQELLPYFKFNPYSEWNDTLSADSIWSSYGMTYSAQQEIIGKLGYDVQRDYNLFVSSGNGFIGSDTLQVMDYSSNVTWDTINGVPTMVNGLDTVVAYLVKSPSNPCAYSYTKNFDRVPDPNASNPYPNLEQPYYYTSPYISVPKVSKGNLTITGCREKAGVLEFVEYVNVITKGPLYFTDAAGAKTLEISDLGKYGNDLPALKSKIIFRDPTFGGIFPEMTQANIWDVIKSLETIKPRSKRICTEEMTPNGYYDYNCRNVKVTDPSDLDLLISTGNLWNGVM